MAKLEGTIKIEKMNKTEIKIFATPLAREFICPNCGKLVYQKWNKSAQDEIPHCIINCPECNEKFRSIGCSVEMVTLNKEELLKSNERLEKENELLIDRIGELKKENFELKKH